MPAIDISYETLGQAAIVKIFQLADLLGCTPKAAAKAYLLHIAGQSGSDSKQAA